MTDGVHARMAQAEQVAIPDREWTVLGLIRASASAEVVTADEVARQHNVGEHGNCGHEGQR